MGVLVDEFAEYLSEKIEEANRNAEPKIERLAPSSRVGDPVKVRTLRNSTPGFWTIAAWEDQASAPRALFGKGTSRGPARFTTIGDVTNTRGDSRAGDAMPFENWFTQGACDVIVAELEKAFS